MRAKSDWRNMQVREDCQEKYNGAERWKRTEVEQSLAPVAALRGGEPSARNVLIQTKLDRSLTQSGGLTRTMYEQLAADAVMYEQTAQG